MAPKPRSQAPANAKAAVYDELAVPEIALIALGFVVLGGLVTTGLGNLVRLVGLAAGKAWSRAGGVQAAVQPVAEALKPWVDGVFGGVSGAAKLEALLLAAILCVLVGMWRTMHIGNQQRAAAAATGVAGAEAVRASEDKDK